MYYWGKSMKKRYILILSMIFVILSISCVSAADNSTDIIKEQTNDAVSIDEKNSNGLSLSANEKVLITHDDLNQNVVTSESDTIKIDDVNEENKEPVKITTKKYYTTNKGYATLKAVITDNDGFKVDEGIVKFTINGKSYNTTVHNGVASKKIKLTTAKTYTYKSTYLGTDNYKNSSVSSAKIYVYSTSKKARTFNIKGYKFTLPLNKYTKLINAKNTGKSVYYKIKTNKLKKQKFEKTSYKWKYHSTVLLEKAHELAGKYPWLYKYGTVKKHWISDGECYYTAKLYKEVEIISYKTKKSRVYAWVSYVLDGQAGRDKYTVEVMTDNSPVITGKLYWLVKSSTISGLKTAKAKDMKNFSMR